MHYLINKKINHLPSQGMATTLQERQTMGLHGLLPPNFISQDDQVERCMNHLSAKPNDLEKYIYLCSLQVYTIQCTIPTILYTYDVPDLINGDPDPWT